jgi:hypothetical protein
MTLRHYAIIDITPLILPYCHYAISHYYYAIAIISAITCHTLMISHYAMPLHITPLRHILLLITPLLLLNAIIDYCHYAIIATLIDG